ncbi:MAG: hypothetical protein QMD77_00240 [Patescibacteria group bacterium]|nr:hypothetical protein [Patescibacteria group bacterium]
MVKQIVGLKVLVLPLAVAFAIMFAVLFVKPAFDDMMAARKDVAANAGQLESLRVQNAKLAELKSQWETMEEKKLVQTALPESEEVDSYMSELYQRVSRSGALLTKFESTKAVSSENISYACVKSDETSVSGGIQPSMQGTTPDASKMPATPLASGAAPAVSSSCANLATVEISIFGNWEQILGLFKYLEDTNRLANISKVAIRLKEQVVQEGGNSDLLSAGIKLNIFYKPKSETGNMTTISSLASGGSFSEEGLKKLKDVVFSAFEEPGVSEAGERNIFK